MARKQNRQLSVSGNNAIGARIEQLAAEHGLSGLARRSSTAVSNIHRYVNGGKVPAEFCAALAEQLHVSPAWLLLGRGSTYTTDVGEREVAVATGMREIVDAMNEASHMKLGSLAQRRDLKLLRDLADASTRHNRLRERLTREVEPVIREWLAALRDSLNRFDHVRGADLEEALERLLGFTDDAALIRDFDRLRAQSAYIQGRRGEAVKLQRRNLMLLLAEGGELSEIELRQCFNLCVALSGLNRAAEGKGVAEATLALRGHGKPTNAQVQLVQSMLAAFELQLGNVSRAVAIVEEIYPRRLPEAAPNVELLQGMIMLRVNGFSAESVLREVSAGLPVFVEVLRNLVFHEDAEQLRHVLEFARGQDARLMPAAADLVTQGELIVRRKGRRATVDLVTLEEGTEVERFESAALACQRARVTGHTSAVSLAKRAHALMLQIPREVCADVPMLGLHARNVLAIEHRDLRRPAEAMRARISDLLHAGFGMFRKFAAQHGIE